MKTITLEITGPVALHGRRPGEQFTVPALDDGQPADRLWRKRLEDEARFAIGAVRVVKPEPDTPTPPAAAETPKKGR